MASGPRNNLTNPRGDLKQTLGETQTGGPKQTLEGPKLIFLWIFLVILQVIFLWIVLLFFLYIFLWVFLWIFLWMIPQMLFWV